MRHGEILASICLPGWMQEEEGRNSDARDWTCARVNLTDKMLKRTFGKSFGLKTHVHFAASSVDPTDQPRSAQKFLVTA